MTQKTVAIRFWTVETSKGYWVLYQIDDNDPIPLHGKPLSREADAKNCVAEGGHILQKAISTYKGVMGWLNTGRL